VEKIAVESLQSSVHTSINQALRTPIQEVKPVQLDSGSQRPQGAVVAANAVTSFTNDVEFLSKLDGNTLETIVEYKISKFLDQLGSMYPEDLHALILGKVEKPLLNQILRRTGGNQVHASKILGINRNTLRKKMKIHGVKA
jgi:DNA-binding protein Fis